MRDLKFFTLLRTLNAKEVDSFHAYLKFEYRNQAIALALFEYIVRFSPGFQDEKRLEMGYAYQKVFKKEMNGKNDRKKVLNVLADLHGWLQDYLICKKATTSFGNRALWLAVLHERGLETEFSKQFSRLHTEMSASPKVDVAEYMKDMAAHHFMYYYVVHTKLDSDADMLQNYEDSLELFYAVSKIKIACEKANRRNVLALPLEPNLSVSYSSASPYDTHPLLLLYREVYQLVALHREESYGRIEAMLIKNVKSVAPAELHRILIYLYNYASSQIRKRRNEFWRKAHWLNKFGVEHAIFLREGRMSVTQFNNIVSAACSAHEIDWASWFVAEQSRFLPEDFLKEAKLLAYATILFEKKQFDKVMEGLEGKEFKNLFDNIRSKTLILKSRYEMGDDEGKILDACLVFEAYLSRHDKHKKIIAVVASSNFVHILKSLIRRKIDRNQIINHIETTEPIYFEDWLLEKTKAYKPI